MPKVLAFLLIAGLAVTACRQGPLPYGGRDQALALARYQDSLTAVLQAYLSRETAYRQPVLSNRPTLVFFAPRPTDPNQAVAPSWQRISTLADSLRGFADTLGIGVELRDGLRLALTAPDRWIPGPRPRPQGVGYLFTPAGVPLEVHTGLPAQAVLRRQLEAYARALRTMPQPRAT